MTSSQLAALGIQGTGAWFIHVRVTDVQGFVSEAWENLWFIPESPLGVSGSPSSAPPMALESASDASVLAAATDPESAARPDGLIESWLVAADTTWGLASWAQQLYAEPKIDNSFSVAHKSS